MCSSACFQVAWVVLLLVKNGGLQAVCLRSWCKIHVLANSQIQCDPIFDVEHVDSGSGFSYDTIVFTPIYQLASQASEGQPAKPTEAS